jgi:hypothetical protein
MGTRAGVRAARQTANVWTAGRWPTSSRVIDTTQLTGELRTVEMWAERRVRIGRLFLEGGARATRAAAREFNAGHLTPRIAARFPLRRGLSVTAGVGRHLQLEQAATPTGTGRNGVAMEGAFRLLTGNATPAGTVPLLHSTLFSGGVEQWLGGQVLVSAQLYRRDASGVLLADPRAGSLVGRPLFVPGRTRAAGTEVALRWFGPRVSGALTYAYGAARAETAGRTYTPSEQQAHDGRADVRADLGWGLNVNAAYARRSGMRYTRYTVGVVRCDARGGCGWVPPPTVGPAGAAEAPWGDRTDLGVEWSNRLRGLPVAAYAQIRNVFGRSNPAAYLDTERRCDSVSDTGVACDPRSPATGLSLVDRRLPPLRGVPTVGLRLGR